MDNWLVTSIPSWNTPDQVPHPRYPMMVVWAESFLFQPGTVIKTQDRVPPYWTWHVDNVTLLQVVGWLGACQKLTIYPLKLSRKMPLSSQLISWISGSHPMPASWWFCCRHCMGSASIGWISTECPHTMGSTLGANFCCGFYLSLDGRWLKHWAHSIVDKKLWDCRCCISWWVYLQRICLRGTPKINTGYRQEARKRTLQ